MTTRTTVPAPDLRIVLTDTLHAHEDHDSQRSEPLIARLQTETTIINPPIVAPLGANQFVILDGANRVHAFHALGCPHLLVQVAPYESGQVELSTWSHVIGGWSAAEFTRSLAEMPDLALHTGQDAHAIAHVIFTDGRVLAIRAALDTAHERNAALCRVVSLYQRNATLQRTASREPSEIFPLYPDAIALVIFPEYTPADILTAARVRAFLPPGVSRHIVHGRAVRVNYPLDRLRDPDTPLRVKNEHLLAWQQDKLARRQVRYYAEATYQFDE